MSYFYNSSGLFYLYHNVPKKCEARSKRTWTLQEHKPPMSQRRVLKRNLLMVPANRDYGTHAYRSFRNFFKLRYFLFGGAVGGGLTIQREYQEWRESLPSLTDVRLPRPDMDKIKTLIASYIPKKDSIHGSSQDFKTRLKNGISLIFNGGPFGESEGHYAEIDQPSPTSLREQYEKKIKDLENEIIHLRKRHKKKKGHKHHNVEKKTLIEMYSEVLDALGGYGDTGGDDNLPRVVVVGDQSSGKTSVLECLARARIFPRGAGEMMTRAPVKVTFSASRHHYAHFKNCAKEYDLTKEKDLEELRKQIEFRMKLSVQDGKTISKDVISLNIKGPNLQRMVLIDLPGIIATQTIDMAEDTKSSIKEMTESYMKNPNAIILCIQDGSVDAERSNVTDLVAECDPEGRRTMLVLTKVDLAEKNLADPERIKKILSGKLFSMKALAYFAVVAGRGNSNDSITKIKEYEENYFKSSKLFKDVDPSHVTTENLSKAVAECFWKMVSETIQEQSEVFNNKRFELETEWKNTFPKLIELDRDEIFAVTANILRDRAMKIFAVAPGIWDEEIGARMWKNMKKHVFEDIYFPAALTKDYASFNTTVDILLKRWTDNNLPKITIQAALDTLHDKMNEITLFNTNSKEDRDSMFDQLQSIAVSQAFEKHEWCEEALTYIQVLQLNVLKDKRIGDKQDWDEAVDFLETSLKAKIRSTDKKLYRMMGPSGLESWIYWERANVEQLKRRSVKKELENVLKGKKERFNSNLTPEDVVVIKKNLENKGVSTDEDFIRETWTPVHKRHILKESLDKAVACRKDYYIYSHQEQEQDGTQPNYNECCDVVMFYRINRMMQVSTTQLRLNIIHNEAQQFFLQVRAALDELFEDKDRKDEIITGRRVELGEAIKKVKKIQSKLDAFIKMLKKEEDINK